MSRSPGKPRAVPGPASEPAPTPPPVVAAQDHAPREPRQIAGIPAILRRWRYIPFFELDVIIADITSAGLKIETHYDVRARPNDRFWLLIPPLDLDGTGGGSDQAHVVLQASCRWYRPGAQAFGASVVSISTRSTQRLIAMIEEMRRAGLGQS